ncbi:MAG: tRNA (cytidine(34)-2'-O)-methyltransferase [Actinobacteria bacterium]|nr:tRNA (cytidine(34)-2'-O)-methyltransferase [Actinomycetota bacterium]MCI0545072.1 tRNA (cytidine(34)-2'-O)-methyltransferase [Actinomycetota bacterium]
MFEIVLYTPEIPPNTGSTMRLAAVTGCRLHLIEPLGFEMEDARLRRAGMDYRDRAVVTVHPDLESWLEGRPPRVHAFTVDGEILYDDIAYQQGDALLFGPESVGLPNVVKNAEWVTGRARLPMVAGVRSINLANAVAIVVYEAWRQHAFRGSA